MEVVDEAVGEGTETPAVVVSGTDVVELVAVEIRTVVCKPRTLADDELGAADVPTVDGLASDDSTFGARTRRTMAATRSSKPEVTESFRRLSAESF